MVAVEGECIQIDIIELVQVIVYIYGHVVVGEEYHHA